MPRASASISPHPDHSAANAHSVPVATNTPGRASWSGILKLFQVVMPVKAYSLITSKDEKEFHQLHAGCGQRIRQQKLCPVHGPVENSDIVKGYEYTPNQHVIVDSSDLDSLRPPNDKAVTIEQFLAHGQFDPALYSGRSFLLLPDGLTSHRPYALLFESLRRQQKWAIGRKRPPAPGSHSPRREGAGDGRAPRSDRAHGTLRSAPSECCHYRRGTDTRRTADQLGYHTHSLVGLS